MTAMNHVVAIQPGGIQIHHQSLEVSEFIIRRVQHRVGRVTIEETLKFGGYQRLKLRM